MEFILNYFVFSFCLLALVFGDKGVDQWDNEGGELGELSKLWKEHGGMLILLFILISPLVFIGKVIYNTYTFLRKGI